MNFSEEFRLLWIVLLNAGVLVAAYRFSRRFGSGGVLQAMCDACLVYFFTQYAAVAIPGILGVLNALTMTLVAAVVVVSLSFGSEWLRRSLRYTEEPGRTARDPSLRSTSETGVTYPSTFTLDHLGLIACALFAAGYLAAYAWSQRLLPPMATDPLVYHLPMAVQWIQTHRLGIYPTWYWNPAASYSPGTGSMFMVWWMAPAGSDLYVRFVQLPPLLFIFLLMARMSRLLGCGRTLAGLFALAATLSRPLFSEALISKDDLLVTSFIVAAILALAAEPMRDRLGPWRFGAAIGLVLASKYTALLACPIFLFMVDSPFRAGWRARHYAIAIGVALLLAGPWYLRNIIFTGNPLYPVDIHLPGLVIRGLFGTERDQQLQTAGGVWHMLTETYNSLSPLLIVPLVAGWVWACIACWRSVLRDPLARAAVIGSAGVLILFLITSPHHEVRYIFPLIALFFVAASFGLSKIPRAVALGVALIIAAVSTMTSFDSSLLRIVAQFAVAALAIAALGTGAVYLQSRHLRLAPDRLALIGVIGSLALTMGAYVEWQAYVSDYQKTRFDFWDNGYPRLSPIWRWINENVPANATVAYANTFFVHPYYGSGLIRRVEYAPVRRGLHDFAHFPRMGDRVPGDEIVNRMAEVMNEDADRQTWLDNLRAMHADYLVVIKPDPDNRDLSADPPELRFARAEPAKFVPVSETDGGVVFRISGN